MFEARTNVLENCPARTKFSYPPFRMVTSAEPFPEQSPVRVVCAIIRDAEGRVLVARRPSNKPLGLKWEFPGGKVDRSEEPRAALAREIREELGVQVEVKEALDGVLFHYDFGTVHLTPFRAN